MKIFKQFFLLLTLSLFSIYGMGQTGYTDDFEGAMASGWAPLASDVLVQSGGVLEITHQARNFWQNLWMDIPGEIDISSNPVVNLKVKVVDFPALLHVYIVDTNSNNSILTQKAMMSSEYINYSFDFSNDLGSVDPTQITAMIFGFNGNTVSHFGTYLFDDLLVGTDATKLSSIGAVDDLYVYENTTSNKIQVEGLLNATSVSVSGGASLITNIVVGAIDVDGLCEITYDCVTDASGTADLTITADAAATFTSNSIIVPLVVEDNIAPTIAQSIDIDAEVSVARIVEITGLSDGNKAAEQTLTLSAVSSNQTAIPDGNINIDYTTGTKAKLTFTATAAATAVDITVTVDDGEASNNTATMTFAVDAYANFNNPPTLSDIASQGHFTSDGSQNILLTEISDGDGTSQTLTFDFTSSVDSVVPASSLVFSYSPSAPTGILTYTPTKVGITMITVTITDDGDDGSNNGDAVKTETFFVQVDDVPATGQIFDFIDLSADTASGDILIENLDVTQYATYIDSGSFNCLEIQAVNKGVFNGTWFEQLSLDITDNPYLSMEVWVEDPMQLWMWFWDGDTAYTGGDRGKRHAYDLKAGEHVAFVNDVNQWVPITFDFYPANELVDGSGEPLINTNIKEILINWHDERQTGASQPPTYTGTIYFRNIRAGSEALGISAKTPVTTIDRPGNQVLFPDAPAQTLTLTGITNGLNVSTGVTVTAASSNTALVPDPTVGTVNADGTAELSYTPNTGTGVASITLTVTAAGSIQNTSAFNINVIDDTPGAATAIDIDMATTYQTILAFGADLKRESSINDFVNDLGGTMLRIFPTGNSFEPVNDNSDPFVLDFNSLKQDGWDYDFMKTAYDAGVDVWFMTLLSPSAWLKQNLSQVARSAGAPNWESTDVKVEYHLYEEYIEQIVAIIRLIQDKTGITLHAVCPQNEPAFTEPYPSAILSPDLMAEFCGRLGERFANEGIPTDIITGEQVFSQGHYSVFEYLDEVKTDPLAEGNTKYIGIHYPGADQTRWEDLYTACSSTTLDKEIFPGECQAYGKDWDQSYGAIKALMYGLRFGKIPTWMAFGYNQGPTASADGLINGSEKTIQYYAYKNIYRYVRPGAVQVGSTTSNTDLTIAAFQNTAEYGEHLAIVLMNDNAAPLSVDVNISNGTSDPTEYMVYRTTENEKCIYVGTVAANDLFTIAGNSITTLVGVGTTQTLTVVNGTTSGDYPVNSQVTITADVPGSPTDVFYKWDGVNVSEYVLDEFASTTTLTMPDMIYTVTAVYRTLPVFTLTVTDGTGGGDYLSGETVAIAADAPGGGQEFDVWTGDVSGILNVNEASTSLIMPAANVNITATYRAITTKYTLTITDGTIDGTGGLTTIEYPEGTVVPITADAATIGYQFVAWTGDVSGIAEVNQSSTTLIMPAADVTIAVNYEFVDFALTVVNGTGSGDYAPGASVAITADTPPLGEGFVEWTGTDVSFIADVNSANTTLLMPSKDATITASYATLTFDLTIIVVDGGTPVSGASVTAQSNTAPTTSAGEAFFLVDYGNVGYSIIASGYDDIIGLFVITSDSTITVDIGADNIGTSLADQIQVYPNPAKNVVNLLMPANTFNEMYLTDISGRMMLRQAISGESKFELQVSDLNSGLYLITLSSKETSYRTAIIIE